MDIKPTNDPAMRNLERTIRTEFEKILLLAFLDSYHVSPHFLGSRFLKSDTPWV